VGFGTPIDPKPTGRWTFCSPLQNPTNGDRPINVVILKRRYPIPPVIPRFIRLIPNHQTKAVIPHIVATPVSYQPFSWVGEAVFRHLTRSVDLGEKHIYSAQVSHPFLLSKCGDRFLRKFAGATQPEMHVKVKYYLEGYPEPQIMLFRSQSKLTQGRHPLAEPDAKITIALRQLTTRNCASGSTNL